MEETGQGFTRADVLRVLATLPDDEVNPVDDDGQCLYRSGDRACVVGRICWDLGLEPREEWPNLPPMNVPAISHRFNNDAVRLMVEIQPIADGNEGVAMRERLVAVGISDPFTGERRHWSQVKAAAAALWPDEYPQPTT